MRKCVIFDLDGTLTRSEEGIWNCVRYAAEKLGFPVPDAATLRKFIGPPLGWSFMEYMGMSEEMANKAVNTYRERYEAVGLFENRGIRASAVCCGRCTAMAGTSVSRRASRSAPRSGLSSISG